MYFAVVKNEHRLHPGVDIKLPERQTERSAGYDFYMPDNLLIAPHSSAKIAMDVKACVDDGYVLMLVPRSSTGKYPLYLCNTVGVIDGDYFENPNNDGNIHLMFFNPTDEPVILQKGQRVVQGVFVKIGLCDDVVEKQRVGGMGSTDA